MGLKKNKMTADDVKEFLQKAGVTATGVKYSKNCIRGQVGTKKFAYSCKGKKLKDPAKQLKGIAGVTSSDTQ